MAVNKVVLGEDTLIDLTADTVSADKLSKGITAHNMAGEPIVGTMEAGGGKEYTFTDGLTETDGTVSWVGYLPNKQTTETVINLGTNNTVYNYSKGIAIGKSNTVGQPFSGLNAIAIGEWN